MSQVVVLGQKDVSYASEIAAYLNTKLLLVSIEYFADTETHVIIPTDSLDAGTHVVLVYKFSTGDFDRSINDQLQALFSCIYKIKQTRPHAITLVLPYFPYARQDDGTFDMVGRCLSAVGAARALAWDLHNSTANFDFPLPMFSMDTSDFWKQIISQSMSKKLDDNFCIISPDEGGKNRVQAVAEKLKKPWGFVRKIRVANDVAVSYEFVGDVRGKHVILVDDIIDTGRTAAGACSLLFQNGAISVTGCFSHAVLSQGCLERIKHSGMQHMFVTNTVKSLSEPFISYVTIDNYLARFVGEVCNNGNKV